MPARSFPFLSADADDPNSLGMLQSFHVLRLLGEGGMGYVFHAIDLRLDRPVAVKVVKPLIAKRDGGAERFIREAKTLASIRHQNVVTIHEVGMEGEFPFIVMELLEGQTLADYVLKNGPLPADEAVAIARGVFAGLSAAHERGVIHRDIKPANIWMESGDATIRLLDFGLSDRQGTRTLEPIGRVAGTPRFLSPEQARGERLSPQSDLYSGGVMLYLLLTGDVPHREPTMARQLAAVVAKKPRPIVELRPNIPINLGRLVDRLLEKPLKNRPNSASDVVATLDEIAEALRTDHRRTHQEQLQWSNERPPASVLSQRHRSRRRKNSDWSQFLAKPMTWWYVGAAIVPAIMVNVMSVEFMNPALVGEPSVPSRASVLEMPQRTRVSFATDAMTTVAELGPLSRYTVHSQPDTPNRADELHIRSQPGVRRARSVGVFQVRVPEYEEPTTDATLMFTLQSGSGRGKHAVRVWGVVTDNASRPLAFGDLELLKSGGEAVALAEVVVYNRSYRLNEQRDAVRGSSIALRDFIEQQKGKLMTCWIESVDVSNQQTRLCAESDEPSKLPKLVIETRSRVTVPNTAATPETDGAR